MFYLDYNATAPLLPQVAEALAPFFVAREGFGNASSIHWAGQEARKRLELARAQVARLLGRKPSEVIFNSGGTEANDLALMGTLEHPLATHRRLILSAVEHPSVDAAARVLAQRGAEVLRIPVDASGQLDLQYLEDQLKRPTTLVSVMAVNNETGVISPLAQVRQLCQAARVPLHVDAVQAIGRIPLPDADLLTISGHKLGAPKGVGVLAIRDTLPLSSRLVGGPQERGHRAGTENVAFAVAFAAALTWAMTHQTTESARLLLLQQKLERFLATLPGTQIVGQGAPRVANTVTAVFSGVDGDAVLQGLDLDGVAASSGSACSSGSLEPSHVLLAMGVPEAQALSAVRFSFGWDSTEADVAAVQAVLPAVLARARS